ncbi:MAG: hypothetical protein R2857_12965 [Vampirovibrionales bacterium]
MLTVGDLVSVSLFVKRVGSHDLPLYYAVIAVLNGMLTAVYWRALPCFSAVRLFYGLIAGSVSMMAASWLLLHTLDPAHSLWVFGVLFVNREITFTFILLHFGNFLQDYFDRESMNRVLAFVYAGGRLGSLMGGFLMATASHLMPMLNFLWVFVGLG